MNDVNENLLTGVARGAMVSFMKPKPKTRAAAQRLSRAHRWQFVITFARLNLATLRPGDWLNLRDDMRAFLAGVRFYPGLDYGPDDMPWKHGDVMAQAAESLWLEAEAVPNDVFVQLQADVRRLLDDLVAEPGDMGTLLSDAIPFQGTYVLTQLYGRKVMMVGGSMPDLFLLMLGLLWNEEQRQALVRCVACGTIFYRYGNQVYCSKTCVNRVAQQRWRDRQGAGVSQPSHTQGSAAVDSPVTPQNGAVDHQACVVHRS